MNFRTLIAASAVALSLAAHGQASAATITVTDLGTATESSLSGALNSSVAVLAINPNALPSNVSYYTGSGTGGEQGWNPLGPNSPSSWLSLNAVSSTSQGNNWTASFSLANKTATTFDIVWGSPSGGNSVTLLSKGTAVGTVNLSSVDQNQNSIGSFPNAQIAGQFYQISSSTAFDTVVFGNQTGGGFELATNVSAVPLPAALPMFGAALAGMGAFARRRKAKKAA
jgi:hypothetical protein